MVQPVGLEGGWMVTLTSKSLLTQRSRDYESMVWTVYDKGIEMPGFAFECNTKVCISGT